ncbi:acyl carrier protein [Streptomyces sp. NPDC048275]|uniref:acyl carrier protein n=1 Tax=Streptomyces sp. NPDC048275 TaxID=3155629 RepID=UPI0033E897DE
MSDNLASSLSPELRIRVRDIVAEVLEVPADEVDETKSFAEDFDADSLLVIEIFSRFERQLGIKIPQDELTDLDDLGAAYELIARRHTTPEAVSA